MHIIHQEQNIHGMTDWGICCNKELNNMPSVHINGVSKLCYMGLIFWYLWIPESKQI